MKEKLASLINVKSIVTIMLTVVFCVLSFKGSIPTELNDIYKVIIIFFFGTQVGKATATK